MPSNIAKPFGIGWAKKPMTLMMLPLLLVVVVVVVVVQHDTGV